jgi:hypothetical protein
MLAQLDILFVMHKLSCAPTHLAKVLAWTLSMVPYGMRPSLAVQRTGVYMLFDLMSKQFYVWYTSTSFVQRFWEHHQAAKSADTWSAKDRVHSCMKAHGMHRFAILPVLLVSHVPTAKELEVCVIQHTMPPLNGTHTASRVP